MTTPRLITLSGRVYHALLFLYPAPYRREYGWMMAQVFRDVCRETYHRRGMPGMALWWCSTLLDLTLTAIDQRRKAATTIMPRNFIIQITGIVLILGSVCGAIASFSQLQPGDHYNYYGVYQVSILFLVPAFLLIGLGGMGIVLRYGASAGQAGRLALLGSGVGALIIAFGMGFLQFDERLWAVAMIGLIIHAASSVAFGITTLRAKHLPIPGWLPLVAGVMLLLLLAGAFRTEASSSGDLVSFAYLLLYSVLWLAMGISIQRDQVTAVPVAA